MKILNQQQQREGDEYLEQEWEKTSNLLILKK